MTRLNKILLLAVMIVCANQMQAQTQMQIEFEKFIEKFPKKEWKDLKDIQRLTMADLQKFPKVLTADANRNIWYEEPQFGPNNIYNHLKEEYQLIDIPFSLSAPVIKVGDDKFKSCYRRELIGCYDEHSPFSPDGTDNEVYSIARLEPFDDVVLLVVGYKYADDTRTFQFAIDALSFCRSTQQMCSAVELYVSYPDPYTSVETLLYDNYVIHSYEFYESIDDMRLNRYIYRLESDGFMHQLEENDDIQYSFATISDPDGYVNVRKEPNVNSEVLYTIKDGCKVYVWENPKSNWAEVVKIDDISRMNGGYVHKSRLKHIEYRKF